MTKRKLKPPKSHQGKKLKAHQNDTGLSHIEHPVFCFKYIEKSFCLSNCERNEQAALVTQLHKLSQLSWNVIHSSQRHGLGCEKINRDAIKAPVPAHITEEVNFYAFRFDGKKPFVGYRNKFIFHIVWIDRSFTLYKH